MEKSKKSGRQLPGIPSAFRTVKETSPENSTAKGDGVPAGDYALLLTFFSQDKAEQIRDGEYDKLGDQYSNLQKPFQKPGRTG